MRIYLFQIIMSLFFIISSITLCEAQSLKLTENRNITLSGGYVNSWLTGKLVDDWKDMSKDIYSEDVMTSRDDFFIGLSYLFATENDLVQFETGLRYVHRGWVWWDEKLPTYDDQGDLIWLIDSSALERLQYLDFYANYKPGFQLPIPYLKIAPFAGLGLSYLLEASRTGKYYNILNESSYWIPRFSTSDEYYRWNLFMQFGVELIIKDFVSLGIEYNRSFNTMIKPFDGNEYWEDDYKPKADINSLQLSLGLKF